MDTRTIRSFFLLTAGAALMSPAFGLARPAETSLPPETGRKIKIVATVFPLAEFARDIAGEKGDIVLLLPPGADVHNWLPRVSDMRKLETADLLVSIGRGLEPWLAALVKGSAARSVPTMEAAKGLDLIPAGEENEHDPARGDDDEGHDHEGVDPHVWLDFGQDEAIVDALTRKLSQIAPEAGPFFSRNAEALKTRLRNLDVLYRTSLEGFRGRSFFVGGHAAFGYLARRYNLVQVAVYGLSPDAGPSPRDMAAGDFTQSPEGASTGRGEYSDLGGGDGAAYSDFFASLFGRPRGQRRARQPLAGRDIETDLSLDLEEASRGGRRSVTVEGSEECRTCGGTGVAGDRVCHTCGGQGAIGKPRTLEVQIPPGAREGTRLRLAGQGEPGRNGGPAGDLYFVVRVRPHRLYRVSGDDLEIDLPVYPWEAAVGTEVEVPTLEGPVALKVPPGAPAGQRLRLRERGLARRNGSRGDLYARLRLVLPATLTEEQRRLLEQVGRLTADSPRRWR